MFSKNTAIAIYTLGLLAAIAGLAGIVYTGTMSPISEASIAATAEHLGLSPDAYQLLHYLTDVILVIAYPVVALILIGLLRKAISSTG